MPEAEESRAASDFMTSVESETPTEETDPSKTQAAAMQVYWSILNGDTALFSLKDYRAPYMGTPLREMDSINYAFVDLGEDGVDELVIDCGDTLILRYYQGGLYSFEFTFRSLYYLKTDGSYSWNHNGSDLVYGENQIFFEGSELRSKELWRIVNDGEPTAEYYIDGKQVSQAELQQYFEQNPKTEVVFSTFEASWKNKVSASQAYELAKLYWADFEIEKNGYLVDHGANDQAPLSVYVLLLRRFVGDHYSTIDEIWIDVNTGDAIVPFTADGK